MKTWRKLLRTDPTDWLLEDDNPSVRYFTLTRILDLPERHKDVREVRQKIMEIGVVPAILAKQQAGGNWEDRSTRASIEVRYGSSSFSPNWVRPATTRA
jgi:hypothetical protein